MNSWYYIIPLCFFLTMQGRQSTVSTDSYFNAVQDKYGRYIVDSNANSWTQYRYQFDSAKAIMPDSFYVMYLNDTDVASPVNTKQ